MKTAARIACPIVLVLAPPCAVSVFAQSSETVVLDNSRDNDGRVEVMFAAASAPETHFDDREKPQLIKTPHYSFQIPGSGNWVIERLGGGDQIVLTKMREVGSDGRTLVQLKVIRNTITDSQLVRLSARKNADNVRNIERMIMLEHGVKPGHYRLHDVSMGEETISGKTFYFMDYETETASDMQPASLYLFFPKERNNNWFVMAHYTEVVPKTAGDVPYSKSELRAVLATLELSN
jgi:hypothetical protein